MLRCNASSPEASLSPLRSSSSLSFSLFLTQVVVFKCSFFSLSKPLPAVLPSNHPNQSLTLNSSPDLPSTWRVPSRKKPRGQNSWLGFAQWFFFPSKFIAQGIPNYILKNMKRIKIVPIQHVNQGNLEVVTVIRQ